MIIKRLIKVIAFFIELFFLRSLFAIKYLQSLVSLKDKHALLFLQNAQFGGTGFFASSLVSLLQENGYQTSIAVDAAEAKFYRNENFGSPVQFFDYQHQTCWYTNSHPLHKYFKRDFLKQAISFINLQIKAQAGLVIVSSARPTELIPVFTLPGRVVHFLHTVPWIEIDNGNRVQLHKLLNSDRFFVAVSEYLKDKMIHFLGLKTENCKVVHNFSADLLVKPVSEEKQELTIVSIGRMHESKNPFGFIATATEVLKQFPNVKFLWVGDGELLEEARNRCKGEDRIQFIGESNHVAKYLHNAEIYFHPSWMESHGVSVVEAMSCALPCVVSSRGGIPESVVNEYNGLLFDPEKVEESVKALGVLITNKDLRKKMGQHSRTRYEQFFSARIWKDKMLELLKTTNN